MDLKGVGVSQFWKVKNFVQEAAAGELFFTLSIEGPALQRRCLETTSEDWCTLRSN